METKVNAAKIPLKRMSSNEKLLWCDCPCSKIHISIIDVYRMCVGIIWCAVNRFSFSLKVY